MVVSAGRADTPESRSSLEELCEAYWYPVYAFVRRGGRQPADAQDLTQEFFSRLLGQNALACVDRDKGRFRSYLLGCLRHFLSNEHDRRNAEKRGGGRSVLSLDWSMGECRYQAEPADAQTPEHVFERRWALTVIERTLARLRAECASRRPVEVFERLKVFLVAGSPAESYAQAAADLGATVGAIKVAAHRLRKRYARLLREEVAGTIAEPDQVEAEIRALFKAVQRR